MATNQHRGQSLLLRPEPKGPAYQYVTPARAGWELLHFAAYRLHKGDTLPFSTEENESVLVLLGGICSIESNRGTWKHIGERATVFDGMPHALYLPRRTNAVIHCETGELDIAAGWCPTDQEHPPQLITPDRSAVELRGGGNASRQINSMVPPGFDCHRIVAVEVYTPPGNWSSYPPHKHDQHHLDAGGKIIEADLEEIYFYKIDKPGGFALQRIYTANGSRDETVVAHDSDLVLVPEGYHPVAAAPGYTVYYLNILAGSAQSLASSDDPAHVWLKSQWPALDPRVPLVGNSKSQIISKNQRTKREGGHKSTKARRSGEEGTL